MAFSSTPLTAREVLVEKYGLKPSPYWQAFYSSGYGELDPANISTERILIKCSGNKLIRVQHNHTVHLLEPGEKVNLNLNPLSRDEIKVDALNNGF